MCENYKQLLEKLNLLKQEYCMTGLKLELETEIISTAEIDLAKELANKTSIELTLKTCGCSAVSDIFLAKALSIKNLLTPMIESPYALEKFDTNVKNICGCDNNIHLLFNIETIDGVKNIDKILSCKSINSFKTIVFGRNDFCSSLGKNSDFADSQEIFNYASLIMKKSESSNLNFILGGNITKKSFDFLNKLDSPCFKGFETRKIVFDKEILKKDYQKALDTALEFELLWLNSKSFKNPLDEQRQIILRKRFD